jgi:hypothetical protein
MSPSDRLGDELLELLLEHLQRRPSALAHLRAILDGAHGVKPTVAAADASGGSLVGQVTTAALAKTLGKTPRAARDWCRRHGIAVRRDGKFNWVDVAAIRRTLDGLPTTPHALPVSRRDESVVDAAATLMNKRS